MNMTVNSIEFRVYVANIYMYMTVSLRYSSFASGGNFPLIRGTFPMTTLQSVMNSRAVPSTPSHTPPVVDLQCTHVETVKTVNTIQHL